MNATPESPAPNHVLVGVSELGSEEPAQGTTRSGTRSSDARVAVSVFLAFLALYLGITRGHFISTDEVAVFQTTRAIWEEGSLAVPGRMSNSPEGRGSKHYSVYSVGPSVAALPLYGVGKEVRSLLEAAGSEDWLQILKGPLLDGGGNVRWGGEVEIFFVNLFNAFVTALLCAVFFALSRKLGLSGSGASFATVLVGVGAYIAPFATGFFHHTSEALFLLWCFYFLLSDAREPNWRGRALAGTMAGLMLLARFQAVIAVPALTGYLAHSLWRRTAPEELFQSRLLVVVRRSLAFVIPMTVGFGLHLVVGFLKWGRWSFAGPYDDHRFSTPLLEGLFGLLLSPGQSIFLFTPLLILTPWALRQLARWYRAEAVFLLAVACTYVLFYAKYEFWHGMWYFGPRYLAPVVPLLLLPIVPWAAAKGLTARLSVLALFVVGVWVQAVHVGPNFWYVSQHERYLEFKPELGFLYIPEFAPIVTHSRALLAWDGRVDMWLIEVYRSFGAGRFLTLAVPLALLLATAIASWVRGLKRPITDSGTAEATVEFTKLRPAVTLVAIIVLATTVAMAADRAQNPREGRVPDTTAATGGVSGLGESVSEVMQAGLDAMYQDGNPSAAIPLFRDVLRRQPDHYGATYQLASALDKTGARGEARPLWVRVLQMAESYGDAETAATAREHLSESR